MLENVFCPNIAPSPGSGNHPFYKAEHMSPGTWKFRCQVPAPGTSPEPGKKGIPEKSFQNAVQECIYSRFPCCVLLALSWNTTNENPSTDKLSKAIN